MQAGYDLRAVSMWAVVRKYTETDRGMQVDWFNNTRTNNIRNIAGNCL